MTDESPKQWRSTRAKPWTWVGTVVTGLGILFLWFGVDSAISAIKSNNRNTQAASAEPLRMTVDLATVGSYTGRLTQTTSHTCKQTVFLEADMDRSSEESLDRSLSGLKGRLRIRTPGNSPILESVFDSETLLATVASTTNLLWNLGLRITPFRRDIYDVELTVYQPAPAMRGKTQFLVSRYLLCGIEQLKVTVVGGIAFIGFVLSFLCFLPAIRFFLGKRHQEKPAV